MIQFLATSEAGRCRLFPLHLLHGIASLIFVALLGLWTQNLCFPSAKADSVDRPNIVLIMADDLGYGDLGCYGSTEQSTPHIDQLANTGIRFADYHSNGVVCSPTRAALLTGRYQQRAGIDGVITAKNHRDVGLGLEEETLAEMLRGKGYVTGIFGKWHLGYPQHFHPNHQGFDEFEGFVSGNIDLFSRVDQEGWFDWWKDSKQKYTPGYAPDQLKELACNFILRHKDQPFFLYVPHPAPHYPYQGPADEPIRKVKHGLVPEGLMQLETGKELKGVQAKRAYRDMIVELDEIVGAIANSLDETGLRKRTLIIFCSDNGGLARPELGSSNGVLRGRKGQLYEGGHRVPAIANWPGRIEAGVCDKTVMSFDLMPTFAELAGADPTTKLDGTSLLPLLSGNEDPLERSLVWLSGNQIAYRQADWKLLLLGAEKVELYNLREDVEEKVDLASVLPERVAEMKREALEMQRIIRADVEMKSGS